MSARKVIADFLKVRDENVPPDECSDDERTESATAIIEDLTAAGYTIIRDDENHKATVERENAFEEVAKWHDKNARLCLEVSRDDPRLNADDRRRAFDAHKHHAASAAAIRNKMSDERRAALRSLIKEDGDAK